MTMTYFSKSKSEPQRYHRSVLLLPSGDPNPQVPETRKFRCRHNWPDGTPCRFRATRRRPNNGRATFWCEQHAPAGCVPVRVEDLQDAARAEYLVSLAEWKPWTAETLAVLHKAVSDLDGARVTVPTFIRALLHERVAQLRPARPATVPTPIAAPAPVAGPYDHSRAILDGVRRVPLKEGGYVTIGPPKVDRPNESYVAPDAEPGFDLTVNRLLHDMKALLTAREVRVESPEVATLRAELAAEKQALAELRQSVTDKLLPALETAQATIETLRRERPTNAMRTEYERLKAEVARLEADNLKLIEEGVALANAAPVPQNEPRGSNAERAPSPGAVAAALMREQREAELEAKAQQRWDAQMAAKADARQAQAEALKKSAATVAPPAKPAKPKIARTAGEPSRPTFHHPLIRALPTIVADLKAHSPNKNGAPIVVLARADKTWRELDIGDREAIVAGLKAWINGSTARLTRVPHTHKINQTLAEAHHLLCARNWRILLDRTAVGWELFDIVHRSDRAIYNNER